MSGAMGPPEELVKKPLTAETAETAEKKIPGTLGELCVLCGKTSHFFTCSGHCGGVNERLR